MFFLVSDDTFFLIFSIENVISIKKLKKSMKKSSFNFIRR